MDTLLRHEILATLVILAGVLLANFAISWILRGRVHMSREAKLRTSVFWRNASFLIAVVALVFVWGSELRAAALSLVALGVAVVLATKELLVSVLGYVYRTTSGAFRFGDIIEIHDVKGEVVDQTLLSTTVLEVGQQHQLTGRLVQFPNAYYLTHPLKNLSRIGRYQIGLLTVPVAADEDVEALKGALEQAAREVCSAFVEPAEAAIREMEGERFIMMPSAEPRVAVALPDVDKVHLILRYPYPADRRMATEQQIIARYLASLPGRRRSPGAGSAASETARLAPSG